MIAFLDASAIIYLLEGQPDLAKATRSQLQLLSEQAPDLRLAVSRLSWLECRVGPLRADVPQRLVSFDAFFRQPDLIWVELDREVVELATMLRARHGLRTPDALQAACCLQLGPEHRMLTGDRGFQKVEGLQVVGVGCSPE